MDRKLPIAGPRNWLISIFFCCSELSEQDGSLSAILPVTSANVSLSASLQILDKERYNNTSIIVHMWSITSRGGQNVSFYLYLTF